MNSKKLARGAFLAVVLLVLAISLFMIFGLLEKIINHMNNEGSDPGYTNTGNDNVYYEGKAYKPNDYLETILVLGIDSLDTPGSSKADSTQADFVALVILDDFDESFRVLHINRDTMTEIPQLNMFDERYGTFTAQLALAHTYGSDDKTRCNNTVDAVEYLLYFSNRNDISINHYYSLTMDAIPIIADSVDGVTVTLENDFPTLGEGYVRGATVTLRGEDALTFVRWRNSDPTASNTERMERQRLFLTGLFDQFTATTEQQTMDTLRSLSNYLVSDCTSSQIQSTVERLQSYENKGVYTLPGEAVRGKEYVEFHVDDQALEKLVIELFYKPVEE